MLQWNRGSCRGTDTFPWGKKHCRLQVSCKGKAAKACFKSDSCDELKAKITLKLACIAAQQRLSKECFPQDQTHGQRITEVQNQLRTCGQILADKNCECK